MSIASEITRLQAAKGDIKAAIEDRGVTVGDGTIDTYAEKIGLIEVGDYNQGYADGKRDEHDAFWNAYQEGGERIDYGRAFNGAGWTDANFKPKYAIQPTTASNMFNKSGIANIKPALVASGVTLDTSHATNLESIFESAAATEIPAISFESCIPLKYTFYGANKCVTIDKLILRADGSNTFQSAFANTTALENIVIEGTIGQNGFNVGHSKKLTHDSLMSIITALADYSADTSGTKWVVTLGTQNLEKLTDAEKLIATEKGWTLA